MSLNCALSYVCWSVIGAVPLFHLSPPTREHTLDFLFSFLMFKKFLGRVIIAFLKIILSKNSFDYVFLFLFFLFKHIWKTI